MLFDLVQVVHDLVVVCGRAGRRAAAGGADAVSGGGGHGHGVAIDGHGGVGVGVAVVVIVGIDVDTAAGRLRVVAAGRCLGEGARRRQPKSRRGRWRSTGKLLRLVAVEGVGVVVVRW